MTAGELEQVTSRLMAEDRASAFASLIESDHRYSSLKDAQMREMQEKLLALTPDRLREAILQEMGRPWFLDSQRPVRFEHDRQHDTGSHFLDAASTYR
jgi:hypothetical protein